MLLLAIDTSTRTMGIALYDGVQVLCNSTWASEDFHTVELAPAVAAALSRSGLKIDDLKALAVATGPGSFTGLRIGLALAKGLALARRLPLVGVRTLDILAASQPVRQTQLAAVLHAGRGRLAVGWYHPSGKGWQDTGELSVLTIDDLSKRIQEPTWVCGELTADERHVLARKRKNVLLASPAQSLRRPSFLAELGFSRWQAGLVDDPASLAPQYLHYNEPIPG